MEKWTEQFLVCYSEQFILQNQGFESTYDPSIKIRIKNPHQSSLSFQGSESMYISVKTTTREDGNKYTFTK